MPQIHMSSSISLNRALLGASMLSAAFSSPIAAQTIAPGTRVRITATGYSVKRYEGTFLKSSRDSIWFISKKSHATQSIPLQNAARVEQSTHYKGRFWRAAAGAGIGMAVVLVAGATATDASECTGCPAAPGAGTTVAGGALLIGAPIGAAIGASRGGEQWTYVSQPLTVGIAPGARARIQLATFRF